MIPKLSKAFPRIFFFIILSFIHSSEKFCAAWQKKRGKCCFGPRIRLRQGSGVSDCTDVIETLYSRRALERRNFSGGGRLPDQTGDAPALQLWTAAMLVTP